MKYHWIDCLMPFPSDRLESPFLHSKMLIINSNEHFRQSNAQLMKFQVFSLRHEKKIRKELFFLLVATGFKTTP